MSKSSLRHDPRVRAGDDEPAIDSAEALALLSDEHASRILELIDEEPASARALSDRIDVSRATVYRRLDRLEEAGLVESAITYDTEGHHRQQYEPRVTELAVSVGSDGLSVSRADGGDESRGSFEPRPS